jgi:1-acyl-sn-glycerol-3-phosphate acyltransferase
MHKFSLVVSYTLVLLFVNCTGFQFRIPSRLQINQRTVSKSANTFLGATATATITDEKRYPRWDWFKILPQFKVRGKMVVNVWGVLFALQCWSLMICWMLGMLLMMPFKALFGNRFDSEGILMDFFGRWWSRLTTFPHSIPRLTGRENIPWGEPCIYVANHQSWMDIPLMGGYLPAMKFVGKRELTKIPILGQSILWGQHIIVDRGNMANGVEVLEQCIDRLRRGISICLFPEGTRSSLPDAEMLSFSKGAFLIAQQAGVRLVPVSLSHTGEVMPTNALLPVRPGCLFTRLHVHSPVETEGKTIKELRTEVRSIIESEIEKPVFANS